MNAWNRIRPYLGIALILAAVMLFGWEVYGRVVHVPHLWGYFVTGMLGAWIADAPGTQGFVTLVLRILPWGRPPSGTGERRAMPPETVVQVEVKKQEDPTDA